MECITVWSPKHAATNTDILQQKTNKWGCTNENKSTPNKHGNTALVYTSCKRGNSIN